jgi:hypothetical protein
MNKSEVISEYFAGLGKISHQKSPRDPEHFKMMQARSVAKRKENQAKRDLLTPAKK